MQVFLPRYYLFNQTFTDLEVSPFVSLGIPRQNFSKSSVNQTCFGGEFKYLKPESSLSKFSIVRGRAHLALTETSGMGALKAMAKLAGSYKWLNFSLSHESDIGRQRHLESSFGLSYKHRLFSIASKWKFEKLSIMTSFSCAASYLVRDDLKLAFLHENHFETSSRSALLVNYKAFDDLDINFSASTAGTFTAGISTKQPSSNWKASVAFGKDIESESLNIGVRTSFEF